MTHIRLVPSLPIKAKRDLIAGGILSVRAAAQLPDRELLRFASVGRVAINAIRSAAASQGDSK